MISSITLNFKERLNKAVSMGLKLTRRRVTEETRETVQSRKVLHFNKKKKKCYTSLKENLEASLGFFPTTILFKCSHSHLSHGKRSPAVSTSIWGLAPNQRSLIFT